MNWKRALKATWSMVAPVLVMWIILSVSTRVIGLNATAIAGGVLLVAIFAAIWFQFYKETK